MTSDPCTWPRLKSGSSIRADEALLTDDFIKRLGFAFATWLAARNETTPDRLTIAVGHDPRASGPRLKAAFIDGLTAADSDVLDCGLSTAPAVFGTTLTNEHSADGAVMITASHLPPRLNGLKFHTREGGLRGEDVDEVIHLAMEARVPVRLVSPCDALSAYQESLRALVKRKLEDDAPKPLLGLHVVVDAGNGSGGFYAGVSGEPRRVGGGQPVPRAGRFLPPPRPGPGRSGGHARPFQGGGQKRGRSGRAFRRRLRPRRHRFERRPPRQQKPPHRPHRGDAAVQKAGADHRHRFGDQHGACALHHRMGRHALPLQARLPRRHRRGHALERRGHRLPAGHRDQRPRRLPRKPLPRRRHVPGHAADLRGHGLKARGQDALFPAGRAAGAGGIAGTAPGHPRRRAARGRAGDDRTDPLPHAGRPLVAAGAGQPRGRAHRLRLWRRGGERLVPAAPERTRPGDGAQSGKRRARRRSAGCSPSSPPCWATRPTWTFRPCARRSRTRENKFL